MCAMCVCNVFFSFIRGMRCYCCCHFQHTTSSTQRKRQLALRRPCVRCSAHRHFMRHSTVCAVETNSRFESQIERSSMHRATEFGNVCVKHVRCSVLNVTFLGTPRALSPNHTQFIHSFSQLCFPLYVCPSLPKISIVVEFSMLFNCLLKYWKRIFTSDWIGQTIPIQWKVGKFVHIK